VIIPDNDEQGRNHARDVATSLGGIAKRVRTLALPDLPAKGDVSNWIASAGPDAAEQLWALVEKATEHKTSEPRSKDKVRRAHWNPEPWPEPVPGAELLDKLHDILKLHIILPEHAAEAMALYILHAWTINAFDISPYLVVLSPTKQCGKTTLLILLYWLTPRSVLASNISGPAAYRFIEKEQPTLIVDEADTFV